MKFLNPVDVVNTESRILSLALNPYLDGDAVIALENGQFQHWTDGQLINLQHQAINSCCNCDELFWMNCVYGSTPKSLLVVHSEDVRLYDMRVNWSIFVVDLNLKYPVEEQNHLQINFRLTLIPENCRLRSKTEKLNWNYLMTQHIFCTVLFELFNVINWLLGKP